MIDFLRRLVFHDFWLKLFSLALAMLIWLTVSFAIRKDVSPTGTFKLNVHQKTFSQMPVVLLSSAADLRDVRISPKEVEITVEGDSKIIEQLQAREIRAMVDLTGIEAARDLRKRIDISTPAGISPVRVIPEEVQITIPPRY
jgi:YbbR domain-containing protein